ncbi:MAG: FAD-binding protein, partial [Nitrososphaerota archaeon]|nr:FAD-binding protein [Nitrososphaerota archaeon]
MSADGTARAHRPKATGREDRSRSSCCLGAAPRGSRELPSASVKESAGTRRFHPTAFCRKGAPHFLITEAVRGEGAHLLNAQGERFMPRYHPQA